jgi:hypothetical protein
MNEVAERDTTSTALIMDGVSLDKMMQMAEIMATGTISVPQHLRGKPGDCLAIIMQSMQWKMNPYAVALKTHVVNGSLGYEAQLVNAVITTLAPTKDRIHYEWFGDWTNVNGKTSKDMHVGVRVWATFIGEDEPRELLVSMGQAGVRNSPLWVDDPRQQIAYLAVKRWARLYTPDVLLGVYTPDELEARDVPERDMGNVEVVNSGTSRADSVKSMLARKPASTQRSPLQLVIDAMAAAKDEKELKATTAAAEKLSPADQDIARKAFRARRAVLVQSVPAAADKPAAQTNGAPANVGTVIDQETGEVLTGGAPGTGQPDLLAAGQDDGKPECTLPQFKSMVDSVTDLESLDAVATLIQKLARGEQPDAMNMVGKRRKDFIDPA